MREMMQEVMGIVGSDAMLRIVIGGDIDMENFRLVMIDDDQETWRGGIGGRPGRESGRQSGLFEETPDVDDLRGGKVLGVGFAHDVAFAGDFEDELAVGLFTDVTNFRDQSDDDAPFEIMCHRMTEYRFERATVRARYGWRISGQDADVIVGMRCFHDAFLTGRGRFRFVGA